ncbi:MAG: VOC family protein [Gemmatimonadales bacterium]
MPRVVHFEIHAAQPERAIVFYNELFGWEFTRWAGPQDYWLVRTGIPGQLGIDGGLLRRRGPAPVDGQAVNAYVCTIEVFVLDELLGRVTALGGSVTAEKTPVPGVGWLAYVKDPEGNIFGLMQSEPLAA